MAESKGSPGDGRAASWLTKMRDAADPCFVHRALHATIANTFMSRLAIEPNDVIIRMSSDWIEANCPSAETMTDLAAIIAISHAECGSPPQVWTPPQLTKDPKAYPYQGSLGGLIRARREAINASPHPRAMAEVLSRAHRLGPKRVTVIRGVEFFDHRGHRGCRLAGTADGGLEVRAPTSGIGAGEEIYLNYTPNTGMTCLDLLARYGFVDPDDVGVSIPNDTLLRVVVDAGRSAEHLLRQGRGRITITTSRNEEVAGELRGAASDFTAEGPSQEWQRLMELMYPDPAKRATQASRVYAHVSTFWRLEREENATATGSSISSCLAVADRCVSGLRTYTNQTITEAMTRLQEIQDQLAQNDQAEQQRKRRQAGTRLAVSLQALARGAATRRKIREESEKEILRLQRRMRAFRRK